MLMGSDKFNYTNTLINEDKDFNLLSNCNPTKLTKRLYNTHFHSHKQVSQIKVAFVNATMGQSNNLHPSFEEMILENMVGESILKK